MKSQIIISVLFLLKVSTFLAADDLKQGVRMTWTKNTNFDNPSNWVGFDGPCSKNIFTFPRELNSDSDQNSAVIALPSSEIRSKLIVLPNNGHFILQDGLTKFLGQSNNENCLGKEAIYTRLYKEDWHNPKNWKSEEENSLLPHVEKVPCQFDSVIFPSNSSFNLKISQNIEVKQFFMGQKSLNYTSIALLLTNLLGLIQFSKKSEILFTLSTNNCSKNAKECLCRNYDPLIEKKICSLVKCEGRQVCPNPMKPNGFCCPICAFHLKINFKDGLNVQMIRTNLKEKIDLQKMGDNLDFYVGKYTNNFAQIIITPKSGLNYFEDMKFIMKEIHFSLAFEEKVINLVEMNSWGDFDSDGKLISNGMSGGIITLIFFFVLFVLCGLFALYSYWKHNGTTGLVNLIPTSMPSFDVNLRIISDYLNRRVSQLSSGGATDDSRSFGFARFSNERISHLNIGQLSGVLNNPESQSQDAGQSQGHQDLSGVPEEKIEIAKLPDTIPGLGFSSESEVTYDLVPSADGPNQPLATNGEKETTLQTPTKKHFEE